MLITKEVEVKWNVNNKNHFIEKGYEFIKMGNVLKCSVNDLQEGNHSMVDVMCDYCGTVHNKEYRQYVRGRKVIQKDSCSKCQQQKTKEVNLVKFGVDSKTKTKEVLQKMENTCLLRHGVSHYSKTEDFKAKHKNTMMERYGVEYVHQVDEFKDKARKTFIDNYGEELWRNEAIINKTINTNMEKYGTSYPMQNSDVMKKSKETMYKNGTAPCSRQQAYLNQLFGGELNYPVGRLSLDIAFPDKKIYIEFDGNGHELSVRMGNISKEDFDTKEIRRYQYLKSLGWKKMTISSYCDYLPSDDILIDEFQKALKWFDSDEYGHSHYNMEIGNLIKDDKYGNLRRIHDEDLN